jgi:hypothetical protein
MKQKQKGFAHLELLAAVIIVVFIGLAFMYVNGHRKSQTPLLSLGTKPQIACGKKDSLSYCLETTTKEASVSDEIKLKFTLKNESSNVYTEHFTSGCTDPDVEVNGKDIDFAKICEQIISEVDIPANTSKVYNLRFSGADLSGDNNEIRALWGSIRSELVMISRKTPSASDLDAQFKNCQKTDRPAYCMALSITVDPSMISKWTCSYWQNIMKQKELSIDCSSGMTLGIGQVYVPKLETDQWITSLNLLPDVKQVSAN